MPERQRRCMRPIRSCGRTPCRRRENKPLTEAYDDYARRQRQDAEGLRRETRAMRAAAPVRGVTRGGSVAVSPEDPFLRGFSQEW